MKCWALILVVAVLGTKSALAELPSVRFDRLTPLGGSAGTTVSVEIAGADVEEVKTLLFNQPGFKVEPVEGKDRQFKVTIGDEVPVGTYDVWLVGRFGVSNPRLFAVSRGLQDVTEVEPNNSAEKAQVVAVNSAINGSSDGNDQDVFRVALKKQQRITVQCQAGRLESQLDSTLSISAANGTTLAANGDYHGRDSFLDFVAPSDGDYLVTLHDLSFRGGHPYRLVISDRPQIENVSPRVVQVGVSTEISLFGRNLGAGAVPSALSVGELPLEELKLKIEPQPDIFRSQAFRFFDHPTDHSTLPTAATCTLTGFQVARGVGGTAVNREDTGAAAVLMLTDKSVTLEVEPNNDRDHPQPLTLPAIVSGRFDQPRDADWYEIKTTEAGSYAVDVYCERIAGRADPYVAVLDDQGNRVTELDDFGHRMNGFDGHLRDPAGTVNLSANKTYRVLVQDRYGRGGARFQYVLKLRKPEPDFFVATMHSQNPGPGNLTIWRGGAARVDLIVHQTEGFTGPITINAENLPSGLHATPTTFSGTSGTFVVWSDDNAPDWTGFLSLVATGKRGDEILRREVRPYTRSWNDANMNSSRPMRQLAAAVREQAPYRLQFEPATLTVEAGKKAELKLKLIRLTEDFKAKVTVLPSTLPNNFKLPNLEFAETQTELTAIIDVAANTKPGDYTMTVLGQAQVPFSKDPQTKTMPRPNTLVSLPSIPVTLTVTEPVKNVGGGK